MRQKCNKKIFYGGSYSLSRCVYSAKTKLDKTWILLPRRDLWRQWNSVRVWDTLWKRVKHIPTDHVIRVRGLLQPGHIWGNLGNFLQVDLHTLHVCLNAVAALWISLEDYTLPRMSTNTHICYNAKFFSCSRNHVSNCRWVAANRWLTLRRCSRHTYSIRSASPAPPHHRSEATGRINQPIRRYHLQTKEAGRGWNAAQRWSRTSA